ncbi:Uncharacterised protein [Bordetella pertussis]|nr:Uncharacterised protein [Bordetella pertussis]CFM13365.1 Uncharacterised protein [Bordetella pertussis]CFM44220.1 Uncharacterised protein [Bordetella pertussis]CFN62108.1 Uncharacterised protein [Bordetella pertussis]CFN63480.1 Uncharacterised protein [Bordetella pertussis]
MPSVISLIEAFGPVRSLKRTWYPTTSPIGVRSSSAMRLATEVAARRRGWVWPIILRRPRPSSRQILGSWVVLPDPVSPLTMTTWWAAMARAISWRRALTGRSSG